MITTEERMTHYVDEFLYTHENYRKKLNDIVCKALEQNMIEGIPKRYSQKLVSILVQKKLEEWLVNDSLSEFQGGIFTEYVLKMSLTWVNWYSIASEHVRSEAHRLKLQDIHD